MWKYSLVLENVLCFYGNCGLFFRHIFLYSPLLFIFVSTSSVTCLLVASIQEEGICLHRGPRGFGRKKRSFVFFLFFENKLTETFILIWYFLTS